MLSLNLIIIKMKPFLPPHVRIQKVANIYKS